jgi:hypothetical protein
MRDYYYYWIETVIEYKDPISDTTSIFIEDVDRKYWERGFDYSWCCPHDPDFEEAPPEDQALRTEIENYGRKVLYETSVWKCNTDGRKRVEELCRIHDIPFDTLIFVYKRKNGKLR